MIFFTHGSLPVKSGFLHLLANLAIAAIENCLLTVDFPIRNYDFPYPWVFTRKTCLFRSCNIVIAAFENCLLTVDFPVRR